MNRLLIGDQWSDSWDDDDYHQETLQVETEDQETCFSVLGPDGNPIPKPSIRFGFHPRGRQ